jgi:hypothetical protein
VHDQPRANIESNLTFCGFIAFECKIRADSPMVVQALIDSDHKVAMLTGDALLTSLHVAKEVGICSKGREQLNLVGADAGAICTIPVEKSHAAKGSHYFSSLSFVSITAVSVAIFFFYRILFQFSKHFPFNHSLHIRIPLQTPITTRNQFRLFAALTGPSAGKTAPPRPSRWCQTTLKSQISIRPTTCSPLRRYVISSRTS